MREITYLLNIFMVLTLVSAQAYSGRMQYTQQPQQSDGGIQCPPSIYPPSPESGCCGFEASAAERAMTQDPTYPRPEPTTTPDYQSFLNKLGFRFRRNANDTDKSIGSRIAGGSETGFFDFPWTAQVSVIFDYGDVQKLGSCGGSLISSRYVLTAAHCVEDDEGGTVTAVNVYLAEYDRTTFPEDCRIVRGAKQCIQNLRIEAEEIIVHWGYDRKTLHNDIALIRLQENAPYTPFIRPVCMPPVDVDNARFANLRLATAGWGLNGKEKYYVKQSTVLNLVLQEECSEHYSNLIRTQMCAVGYSGEDTCEGDSGGPLMMAEGQKYYVVGIVSGARMDVECGSSVPSLYTNVYQYLDWILDHIR